MGLLAPLYALAALAVAGPIIFHLIRRQPQGQMQFSSLMFLQPSPPRLTRRSRIDNWLLLLLRALAIALIALAFMRPYLRQESLLNMNLDGRNIVAVLDTSASMRRDDVWQSAVGEMDDLLNSLADEDRIALYTLDSRLNALVTLESSSEMTAEASQLAVRQAMQGVEPSWQRTELARGLTTLADMLSAETISGDIQAGKTNEIILITDLHQESGLEALQGYPWPESVGLDVRPIAAQAPGNARPSLMATGDTDSDDDRTKVRIENNADSAVQNLEIAWATDTQTLTGTATTVQVPAGQIRVVTMPAKPASADRVILAGDAWDGDNDVFVAESDPEMERIGWVGAQRQSKEEDPGYFLSQAPLNTTLTTRNVETVEIGDWEAAAASGEYATLVVAPTGPIWDKAEILRNFAQAGQSVVVLTADPMQDSEPQAATDFFRTLLQQDDLTIDEQPLDDYAMFGWVDYRHPVFAPFADPRFNDFSKIRIWTHRSLKIPDDADLDVVAKYDNGFPLLVRQRVGKGQIWIFTCGWQTSGSTLALSSKFLPILLGILDPEGQSRKQQSAYAVGESIEIGEGEATILDQTGALVGDDLAMLRGSNVTFLAPGMFTVETENESPRTVAVQVPPSESQMTPLDVAVFEQFGVQTKRVASETERKESARQKQVEELERQQRVWQWLLAAGIVVLAVETLLAGLFARQQNTIEETVVA